MATVAYMTPYGVGLGHASRLVMVADELKEDGMDIIFSSYGEATNYVSLRGYKCASVSPVEFAWSMEGGFSVKNSLANIPLWFTNFSKQVNQEIRNLIMWNPSVVVSDSRLSPLVAAKMVRVPSVVVLNQIKLLLSPRLRELAISRIFENIVGEFLGKMWNMADRILVPDLPPPYTISAHNVWGIGTLSHKLEYIGFASPKPQIREEQVAKAVSSLGLEMGRPIVFVHVSGPFQTRPALIKVALESVKKLDPKVQVIISEGNPKGKSEPKRIAKNSWFYEWCPVRDELFTVSDLLVLRGGHVALSQAILFGKPVVSIPIENHGEQLGNSAKLAELGAAVMIHPKHLNSSDLSDAVEKVLVDPEYKKNASKLRRRAESLDGIDNIVRIVRSYC